MFGSKYAAPLWQTAVLFGFALSLEIVQSVEARMVAQNDWNDGDYDDPLEQVLVQRHGLHGSGSHKAAVVHNHNYAKHNHFHIKMTLDPALLLSGEKHSMEIEPIITSGNYGGLNAGDTDCRSQRLSQSNNKPKNGVRIIPPQAFPEGGNEGTNQDCIVEVGDERGYPSGGWSRKGSVRSDQTNPNNNYLDFGQNQFRENTGNVPTGISTGNGQGRVYSDGVRYDDGYTNVHQGNMRENNIKRVQYPLDDAYSYGNGTAYGIRIPGVRVVNDKDIYLAPVAPVENGSGFKTTKDYIETERVEDQVKNRYEPGNTGYMDSPGVYANNNEGTDQRNGHTRNGPGSSYPTYVGDPSGVRNDNTDNSRGNGSGRNGPGTDNGMHVNDVYVDNDNEGTVQDNVNARNRPDTSNTRYLNINAYDENGNYGMDRERGQTANNNGQPKTKDEDIIVEDAGNDNGDQIQARNFSTNNKGGPDYNIRPRSKVPNEGRNGWQNRTSKANQQGKTALGTGESGIPNSGRDRYVGNTPVEVIRDGMFIIDGEYVDCDTIQDREKLRRPFANTGNQNRCESEVDVGDAYYDLGDDGQNRNVIYVQMSGMGQGYTGANGNGVVDVTYARNATALLTNGQRPPPDVGRTLGNGARDSQLATPPDYNLPNSKQNTRTGQGKSPTRPSQDSLAASLYSDGRNGDIPPKKPTTGPVQPADDARVDDAYPKNNYENQPYPNGQLTIIDCEEGTNEDPNKHGLQNNNGQHKPQPTVNFGEYLDYETGYKNKLTMWPCITLDDGVIPLLQPVPCDIPGTKCLKVIMS